MEKRSPNHSMDSLIDSLSNCLVCKIGPLQPTYKNIKGEIKMGFGGYLYIVQKLRTVK